MARVSRDEGQFTVIVETAVVGSVRQLAGEMIVT